MIEIVEYKDEYAKELSNIIIKNMSAKIVGTFILKQYKITAMI